MASISATARDLALSPMGVRFSVMLCGEGAAVIATLDGVCSVLNRGSPPAVNSVRPPSFGRFESIGLAQKAKDWG